MSAGAAARTFHATYGETYRKLVAFVIGFSAYLFLGTDEFPTWDAEGAVQYRYQPSGTPTVGSALLRIITVLPHLFVLTVLSFVGLVAGLVA